MKIYVASSWRNPWQPETVKILRASGHEVYDFRMGSWDGNPHDHGFSWREIDEHWHKWTPAQYRKNLSHPASERGFKSDMDALKACDACLLILPCGSSAHLELGYAIGAQKKTAVLFPHGVAITPIGRHSCGPYPCEECSLSLQSGTCGCRLPDRLQQIEPELMTKAADSILIHATELRAWSKAIDTRDCRSCLNQCMDMDMDPYCAAPAVMQKHPYGLNLCRGKPSECGPQSKLWTLDIRRIEP